jgi:hypothetical protein
MQLPMAVLYVYVSPGSAVSTKSPPSPSAALPANTVDAPSTPAATAAKAMWNLFVFIVSLLFMRFRLS